MGVTDFILNSGNPRSLAARARRRRWEELQRRFPDLPSMRVVDLGGTPRFWRSAPIHPERVTVLNIDPRLAAGESWIDVRLHSALEPRTGKEPFDLVVSNSLLEHVGGAEQRQRLADVIHQLADRYWVQTPNRSFPIEPHWLFPGFQFLPLRAKIIVTRTWPLGHRHARDRVAALRLAKGVELIGKRDMERLFPDAELWIERFAGLPKSLVAIRTGPTRDAQSDMYPS